MIATRRTPPKKQPGQGLGPRGLTGDVLDVRSASKLLGCSEKMLRARISRRLIPFRKFSGRVVLLRSELHAYLATLPGCTLDEAVENMAARRGTP